MQKGLGESSKKKIKNKKIGHSNLFDHLCTAYYGMHNLELAYNLYHYIYRFYRNLPAYLPAYLIVFAHLGNVCRNV